MSMEQARHPTMGIRETLRTRMNFGRAACFFAGAELIGNGIGLAAGLNPREMVASVILSSAVGIGVPAEAGYNIWLERYSPRDNMERRVKFFARDTEFMISNRAYQQ